LKNKFKNILTVLGKKILNIFWIFHKPIVKKNIKLKNIHKGETCFIFANGGSLKNYDISKLPKNSSIVCSYSLVDKRMNALNIKYFVNTDSYTLYSYIYNTHPNQKKFQFNKIKLIFSELFNVSKDITTFVNITNFYAKMCRRENIYYYHYFNDKEGFNHDLAGNFSNCRGALDTMLGVAKYLGFSKAVLFGCDYLGDPAMEGHFYNDKKQFSEADISHLSEYRAKVKLAAKGIELTVILPEGITSPDFNYDSYERYFNLERKNQENNSFIEENYLQMMRDASKLNQIGM
jgi:hypothetical protein